MKKQLPTVTIGIAAYNEQKNIGQLLQSLLHDQKQTLFVLESILIADDGSTDATVEKVKAMKDKRIRLIQDGQRLGKAGRVEQLLRQSTSDILVLMDADVELAHTRVLDALIRPMTSNPEVTLTSGAIINHQPHTFTQQVIHTGTELWDACCALYYGSGSYYCSGSLRALRKSFYSKLQFPRVTAEDVYPYLFQQYHHLGQFAYAPKAAILNTVPSSIKDYLSQMRRYLRAIPEQATYFDAAFVQAQFPMSTTDRLKVLAQFLLKHPLCTTAYLGLRVLARISTQLAPVSNDGIWDEVASSK